VFYRFIKKYLFNFMIFSLLGMFSAHSQDTSPLIDLTPEERAWLSENKEILVATDPTMAPLEFIGNDGEISGLAGEYLKLISEKIGVSFVWSGNENWTVGVEQIHAKEAHMVSAANNTAERREFLTFIEPFLNVSYMIFAIQGGDSFGNMDALAGKTISQVKGFSLSDRIKEDYPEINIVEADTVTDALYLLSEGEVDAYVGSIAIAAHYISEEGLFELIVVGGAPYRGENAMGIRSELPLLASAMNKAMSSISVDQRAVISRKWLALSYEPNEYYELLLRGGIVGLIILFSFLIWNYSLRREILMRKIAQSEMLLSQKEAKLAQSDAEEANEAKSTFLANMSHELRTPLNAIIGFSDTMSSGIYGKIVQPKYLEYLEHIKDSGHHLENVINDILDLSKIEAGKWQMDFDNFSLVKCLQSSLKMLEVQAKHKNIDLHIENLTGDDALTINRDESAYKRIIINLLSNAVKFTPKGGVIKCKIEKLKDDIIKISIIDSGIGISEKNIDKVIVPFGQVPETRELNKSGTGLGLPIVKQLAELQGDEFILESKLGEGTKASVVINV